MPLKQRFQLNRCTDVHIDEPLETFQVLVWNNNEQKWVNRSLG